MKLQYESYIVLPISFCVLSLVSYTLETEGGK